MDPRTKKLITVFAVLLVMAGGYYMYQLYKEKKAPPRKVTIVMRKALPRPKGAQPKAAGKPGAPAQPAGPAAAAPSAVELQKAYAPTIVVTEKGREVEYPTPAEFLQKTSLSPAEIKEFAARRLDDAKKSADQARAGKDRAATDKAEADLRLAVQLKALAEQRQSGQVEQKAVAYMTLGKRDPFMSPMEVPKVLPVVPANARPVQRVPTESLTVKAIIWAKNGFRAMVTTPDGRAYTVQSGETVGNKLGKITKITENRVFVTEKLKDILGDIETKNIVLKLHKEAE